MHGRTIVKGNGKLLNLTRSGHIEAGLNDMSLYLVRTYTRPL